MSVSLLPNSSLPNVLEIKRRLLHGFNSFKQFKHIHARLLRLSLDQDNYLLNLFLKVCFSSGHTDYGRLLFNQTQHPNIFLYNTMIQGLVSNDFFQESIELYSLMRRENFLPNSFTFPFVLKACSRLLNFHLGLKIHTLVVKSGYDGDEFVKTGLVSLYSKCGYLNNAGKVFDEIPLKNIVSLTAIISGYINSGRFREAMEMFQRSLENGLRADSITLVTLLSACSRLGGSSDGEWLHKHAIDLGLETNVFVGTALVDLYAKYGKMVQACQVFDSMPDKDTITWSAMIQGYAMNGHPKEAVDLFYRMQELNIRSDCYSIVGVLSACAGMGALSVGEWAASLIDINEFLLNPIMGTALIDMYAKCGKMSSAWEVFKTMKEKDLVVWNAVISGLAMNGYVKTMFSLLGQMEKHGLEPNNNTITGLLCGCTHAGLVNEGRRVFYSIIPTVEHYGCIVDLLGRAGLLKEAYELILNMPMEANAVVWGALLSGCRMHRDSQMAEHVLERLVELEPWNSSNYVLLSNIHSTNQKWDDVAKIRSTMAQRRIQKAPGFSWIEMDGVVHKFIAGDKSHRESDRIYAELVELRRELSAVGYAPTTEFVHFDVEEEEKECSLGFHSEKLAVAFGLFCSSSASDVIRVVKNLRICGDCHLFMKHLSRVRSREIIIRDNSRFHHFVDGSCSCNDYW
ncbi:putative pentatricopeptide repeat-containing protein At3g08820 [Impatiens glandulifera]|uniref:putative pentatricopeptide repeat-containing protein At3g08820 n=1 Tax=Impatiens glandulifera TaxID=253017 RepID=UPI001FB0D2FE|nr:putative pentatricopeptide repeat-containing protein At3g08820 [Impatiens glandulifera]